jgi:hypothetical protein
METVDVTPEMITEGLGAFDELEFLGKGTFGTTFRAARGDRESAIKWPSVPGHLAQALPPRSSEPSMS